MTTTNTKPAHKPLFGKMIASHEGLAEEILIEQLAEKQAEEAKEAEEAEEAAIHSKIVALIRYALKGSNVRFCCDTSTFSNTYAAVQKQAEEQLPHMMGADVDWCPNTPGEITVFKTSSFNGGTITYFQVPVEGAVAEALLLDMQAVALEFAQAEILEERKRALQAEAKARVLELMAFI